MRLFNDGWTFLKTALGTGYDNVKRQIEDFYPIDIPHDWLIYDGKNLYEDSCGWYYKRFRLTDAEQDKKRFFLRFDGVYMDTTIYVNGKMLGDWKYGYSTFYVDMTPSLVHGENEVLVQVRHQAPNSRWYSGAGIYRNVWIGEYGAAYLIPDGTYVTQSRCGEGCRLTVQTEVSGQVATDMMVHYVLRQGKQQVLDLGRAALKKQENGFGRAENILGMENPEETLWKTNLETIVEHPLLWDLRTPVCYQLEVQLMRGEHVLQTDQITIGFRTMEFNPQEGFFLNGRKIKVHGVCEHHDFGCLGAAFHTQAMRRKFQILREMGVNAIRTSHNMPAAELMELADEMGFLVLSEGFDMWERSKTTYDYGRFFTEWSKRDVSSWIRRDRNHPSLMLWSIGNEIYDTHADERGQELTRQLSDYVREYDPAGNAQVTIGSNYMGGENARKCADILKFAGYNYGERYYREQHAEHPDWVIYGSETSSIAQSRGVYHFPLKQQILSDEDEQCSSLGNSATSYGAKNWEECITADRDADYVFGQFLWTGFDYIGEPTPYHTRNSYFGQVDTAGFPKDAYYVFQSQWADAAAPMVHVFPYWDFNEGQTIDVRACTNAASIELFVNGRSMGRQDIDHIHGKKLLGEWQVSYEPGTIQAVAYDEAGNSVAVHERHSFGNSARITVSADRNILYADGEDLCFVTIGTEDALGYPVENAMDYVSVHVQGPGRLLGLDNGDSTDFDDYKCSCRKLFNGKLLAVIGTTDQTGEIKVLVQGEGLEGAVCKVAVAAAKPKSGISFQENVAEKEIEESYPQKNIPVRRIDIQVPQGTNVGMQKQSVLVCAQILPENASDRNLIWKAVNAAGIELDYVKIEELEDQGEENAVRVTAYGDGDFMIRCMSKSGTDKIKLISQMEFSMSGIGQAYLNPYGFISAGLYTDVIGEIGNGNEKGIATARDGRSGVYFSGIDFGEYGSDIITMSVFALSGEEYPIEIWEGMPGQPESQQLTTVYYQKPSKWNVYQEESWKLSKRLKGVTGISFVLHAKVHIKGFYFQKLQKAFCRLNAAECSTVYGDSYTVEACAVTGIGNNVTLSFDNMDFGEKGAGMVTICGRTRLDKNTIHIQFIKESGAVLRSIAEFEGSQTQKEGVYQNQTFSVEGFCGRGTVEFIFLPGSSFDFSALQFSQISG